MGFLGVLASVADVSSAGRIRKSGRVVARFVDSRMRALAGPHATSEARRLCRCRRAARGLLGSLPWPWAQRPEIAAEASGLFGGSGFEAPLLAASAGPGPSSGLLATGKELSGVGAAAQRLSGSPRPLLGTRSSGPGAGALVIGSEDSMPYAVSFAASVCGQSV